MLSHYQSILDAMPMPAILVGADERVMAQNAAAAGLMGSGLPGRHYIVALRQPNLLDAIERVLTGREDAAEAVYLATEAMRDTTYDVHVARIEVASGPAILVSFRDTTDLQVAGQMRRDFVANVSHELRTPLTALLGFIETLRGAARDDAAARDRFLGIMETEAGRMNRLVRDLLSLSRVESEERVRPQKPVDLAALVRSAASTLRPMAEEAGLALDLIGTDVPAIVPGDADQLSQILSNLIENAVKYGRSGTRVTVSLDRSPDQPYHPGRGGDGDGGR